MAPQLGETQCTIHNSRDAVPVSAAVATRSRADCSSMKGIFSKSVPSISLLCIPYYKLYERLIPMRISPLFDKKLTEGQAGFGPGRPSAGHLLDVTQSQDYENGFESKIYLFIYYVIFTQEYPISAQHCSPWGSCRCAAFVDLAVAYDTVQHRLMTRELHDGHDWRLRSLPGDSRPR